MFCSQCGKQLDPGAGFCSFCGAAVNPGIPYQSRRLVRPLTDRMIGGVCAAFALAYGWDVTLVRIVTVLIVFFSGIVFGVIAYLIAWVIIPQEQYPLPSKIPSKSV